VGEIVQKTRRAWPIDKYADDRLDAHQGAPLCLGRKKGEQKQAIGRSRGGRNTKIRKRCPDPTLLSVERAAHDGG
jgi:hypothetical protein